ncbi:MAG: 4Fe-4S dicluster domain-containing protein [Anaerolineae bacterium]|nr:4Fe-4S dicluster domain-containing protein [Anaerolineae bacterium]
MADHRPESMNAFLADVLDTEGGKLVLQCYQCGTCSGSCPVFDDMEYGPRRILAMILSGMETEVLSSKDMWRCVSCYSCANRCPRGIEITDLMADLRRLAAERGFASDKEAEFGQAFAETVQVHGRLFEPELLARYYARVLDLVSLIGMAPLGIRMLLKGKLPLVPERVNNPNDIADIGIVNSTRPMLASRLRRRKAAARATGAVVGSGLLAVLAKVAAGLRNGRAA